MNPYNSIDGNNNNHKTEDHDGCDDSRDKLEGEVVADKCFCPNEELTIESYYEENTYVMDEEVEY